MRSAFTVSLSAVLACAVAAQPPTPRPWYDTVVVKGWIQLDATFAEGSAGTNSDSNFRIRRARPTIIAQIDPLTKVQLQIDVSTGRAGSGAVTTSVMDTYAMRTFPGFGHVLFGQFLLPFGLEIRVDNASARSPLEISFAAENFGLGERDIGVFVQCPSPDVQDFTWEAAVLNGQGARNADSNNNKTVAGRIAYRLSEALRVGVSGLLGAFRSGGVDYDREVVGAHFAAMLCRELTVKGEFYDVRFVDNPSSPTQAAQYQGGYLLVESWVESLKSIPFVRFQRTWDDLDYESVDIGWRYQYAPTQRLTLQVDLPSGGRPKQVGLRWQLGF